MHQFFGLFGLCLTLEAIKIRSEPHTMNLDCGLHLSPAWYSIVNSYRYSGGQLHVFSCSDTTVVCLA